jgi:lipooligosaccharide transport system permease protein
MKKTRSITLKPAIPKLTYRLWKVWRRDFDVFMKTYKVNFLPPLFEPILYLLAMGFGLGFFLKNTPIEGVSYIQFIAPALIAISMMYGSFFECTYGSFVRMYYQKTFEGIITTPVSVEEVIAGELLWGATRASINSTIVLAVVAAFRLLRSPLFMLIPVLSFLIGLMFFLVGYVLHGRGSEHRFLQLPRVSVYHAYVLIIRHVLPSLGAPFGRSRCGTSYLAVDACRQFD